MLANLFSIDPNSAFPIDRAEVQQDMTIAAFRQRTDRERELIPEPFVRLDGLLDSTQGRLDGKRNQNLAVPLFRTALRGGPNRVLPDSVKICPFRHKPQPVGTGVKLADHLRPR